MPEPDAGKDREERLAELLALFEERKAAEPHVGIGVMREEAGELFPDLVERVDTASLLRAAIEKEPTAEIGDMLGRFEIKGPLGRGGIGSVYRAVDPVSGKVVALKVLRESVGATARTLERFRQEGIAASGVDHPHVVPVIETGEAAGRLFIVMELIEGGDLGHVLKDLRDQGGPGPGPAWHSVLDRHGVPASPKPSGEASIEYARRICALFSPVADALAATAAAGVVHRDVKPRNLLLTADGRLLLSDFGLAKVVGTDLTSTTLVMGTPAYLSPEQARGESRDVDVRSDLYSLGCALYEALTLRPPFAAATYRDLLGAILTKRPPRLRELAPFYPRDLEVLVHGLLEREREDRIADPAAVGRALFRVSRGEDAGLRPAPRIRKVARRLRKRPKLVAAVSLVVLLVLGYVIFRPESPADLRVTALPAGILKLNEVEQGETPWEGEVVAGEYSVVVVREGFGIAWDEITLEPGEKRSITLTLFPERPLDPQTLKTIAEAHGIELTLPDGDPARGRNVHVFGMGVPFTEYVTLVTPRGRMTRSGVALAFGPHDTVMGLHVEVRDLRDDRSLGTWTIDVEKSPVLPEEIRRRFVAGGSYLLTVTKPGEEGSLRSEFTVVEGSGFADRIAGRERPKSGVLDDLVDVLVVSELLEDRLFAEAFIAARDLWSLEPMSDESRVPLRLALAALEGLGLADSPLFEDVRQGWAMLRDMLK